MRDSEPVAPERERVVYLQQDRKCPRFSGCLVQVDSLAIEDWIEEVESHVQTKQLSQKEKTLFVYNQLEGEAHTEIQFQPSTVHDSDVEMFKILRELYGSSHSHVSLQRKFFK